MIRAVLYLLALELMAFGAYGIWRVTEFLQRHEPNPLFALRLMCGLISLACILAGWRLLKLKSWAHTFALAFIVVGVLVMDLPDIISLFLVGPFVMLRTIMPAMAFEMAVPITVLNLSAFVYMLTPNVMKQFREPGF